MFISNKSIFSKTGIFVASTKLYTLTFASKKLAKDSLLLLDCSMLKELNIKTMGEMLAVQKLI